VLPWHYTGTYNHPTEKSVDTLMPIIEAFTKAGEVVLDPFAGSGSSLVAAALLRRQYVGIELEEKYCDHARRRLAGVTRHFAIPWREPQREEGTRRAGVFRTGFSNAQKGPA
jgi:site-specific DNA-methyltransferase (adenine-specific)